MKYRESSIDKALRKKFANDFAHANLRRIRLAMGSMRGLTNLDIDFEYPITAIAGKNGAGKSTILALACCAYHNDKAGYKLPKRRNSYYTFSDFFIQHEEEIPPDGIYINYLIAHDNWRISKDNREKIRLGWQTRKKSWGGRWNDYATRVSRDVVFLGIERIVPHIERSQSRSYSRAFSEVAPRGWEIEVKETVGRILSRNYDDFRYFSHSKYSLPVVRVNDTIYSGFNMGAGESALFEIFATIHSCKKGSLLVMDEIELGLHAEAQGKLIKELKKLCLNRHIQIICTTHSKEIFDSLPYDARYYIESIQGRTKTTPAISSTFAFSKLAATPGIEGDILVEDEVAVKLLQVALPASLRTRVTIHLIGSATALSRQLAAIKIKSPERPTIAIYDGDQRALEKDNLHHAKSMCEKVDDEFENWYSDRISYLPGDSWPESWLVQRSLSHASTLASLIGTSEEELKEALEYGKQAGKHNEFYEISKHLGIERDACLQICAAKVTEICRDEFSEIIEHIEELIEESG